MTDVKHWTKIPILKDLSTIQKQWLTCVTVNAASVLFCNQWQYFKAAG